MWGAMIFSMLVFHLEVINFIYSKNILKYFLNNIYNIGYKLSGFGKDLGEVKIINLSFN